jgi:putative membrane protein
MSRSTRRLLPLLFGVLALALGGASLALAHGTPTRSSTAHKGDGSGECRARHKGEDHQGCKRRHDQAQQGDDEQDQQSGSQRCDSQCQDERFSAWDEEWLMMSIEGDRFEIAGGMLAQHKATTQIVRDLGARLVADHTKSLQDAVDLATKLGIEVPSEPSPSQQWELRAVAQFSGKAFDRWYSDLEVQDHIQDIQETSDEVEKGCNPDVRQEARDDLPVLQQHLELAKAALAAVSGS